MAITPGFEYDIFLSYAHQDNTESWVTQFAERLQNAICRFSGRSKDELRIFFDLKDTAANFRLPELLEKVQNSAIFLGIGSPSFVHRAWTKDELETFAAKYNDPSRIFLIELLPLSRGAAYPTPVHSHIHTQFWEPHSSSETPVEVSPASEAFKPKLNGLALSIKSKLEEIGACPVPVRFVRAASARAAKTVFLAQATDDVEEETHDVRLFLSQFPGEVEILPSGTYPQGGEAFREAVANDIRRAQLFVQLLGKRGGRIPPDLLEGYTRCQLDAAQAARVPIMQWRHPQLDLKSIPDASYQAMLQAETVVASGLEAFKHQVLTWAPKRAQDTGRLKLSTVFISADDGDMGIAAKLEQECRDQALTTFLPMSGSPCAEKDTDLDENLKDCDVLVFVYGDTTPSWIRAQLRRFSKIRPQRQSDPKLVAICSGPPPKGEFGIHLPNAQVIHCDNWDLARMRELLSGIER